MPKVELHVHLEGSIALPTLLELARTQPDSMLPRSEEGLLELYRFRDFAHFLEVYLLICRHLRSAEEFALITRELGASLAAHPLPRLIEEGLVVTLNSDDPPMFGTSLREEYLAVARTLGLDPAGLRDLARNAARAAFLPQAEAQALVAEIDSVSLPPPGPANGPRASE